MAPEGLCSDRGIGSLCLGGNCPMAKLRYLGKADPLRLYVMVNLTLVDI
jgi:hypothetical protein